MRVALEEQLNLAEATLQEECSLTLRMLGAALGALRASDHELAEEVISFDDEVDEKYLRVEQIVEELVALQAPTARDMRLVLAISKINLHVERMADYCVTIAKLTKLAGGPPADTRLTAWLIEMGERAQEMIRIAMRAFADRDAEAAESLITLDEMINRTNRKAVEWVVEILADEGTREWAVRMMLVSRSLERIGDHAVDIGEQTAYLVTGEFREFTDASHP